MTSLSDTSVSLFARIFRTERIRPRASVSAPGEARPWLGEIPTPNASTFVVTNSQGYLVKTRETATGTVRYGFTKCPLEEEVQYLGTLYSKLLDLATAEKWSNTFTTIDQALKSFSSRLLEPKILVIPKTLLNFLCPDVEDKDIQDRMQRRGFVARLGEKQALHVMVADLPDAAAMLFTSPLLVGTQIRSGDYFGMILSDPSKMIALVTNELGQNAS